ncbi:MAG: tetratricopeptide repeat protein [Pseudomonadota bacterium]
MGRPAMIKFTIVPSLAALLLSGLAAASPYLPASGAQVLERLPSRSDPVQRALAQLRARLKTEPDNVALAAELAQRYISLARNDADPRYLGYAQAALAPWWGLADPPPQVLVLRATILQSTHRFPQALADLDLLLRHDRNNGQAWITRATILQVTGDFAGAKTSCARLFGQAADLVIRTCLASANSLSGAARPSYLSLKMAFDGARHDDSAIDEWVLTLLAEMAARLGDYQAADSHFRQALALAPGDTYLLGAYADFLLDRGRHAEVRALLQNQARADGLLLRHALALAATPGQDASAETAMLRDRFQAAMLRGDTVHQREQSRFELHLMKNPTLALSLAQKNWAVQKEPADVRVLLEAAAASGDRAAARPVLDWLKQVKLEDASLAALVKTLEPA